nr:hypothetical protein [uncultured bacterium]
MPVIVKSFAAVVLFAEVVKKTVFEPSSFLVVHVFVLAMNAGVTVDRIRRAVPIHPTVSELLPTLLEGLKPLPAQASRSA